MTKATKLTIGLFCLIKLALHLIADANTGFQGDELLHIQTGHHLAFGYMEFPPLIGLLAHLQNLLQSTSVSIHHLFAHLAALLIMIYAAKTVIVLGGKWKAVFLVLLCILIAPGFGRSQQLFQPVVFSQLFWLLGFHYLTKAVKLLKTKYLWYLTLTATLGFLVKYDVLFFLLPLVSLFFFPRTRGFILHSRPWRFVLLFLILILPNLWWQHANGFPVMQMMDRLYETQLDHITFWRVGMDLILAMNPVNLIVVLFAVTFAIDRANRDFVPLALCIFLSMVLLALSNGKAYYYFPIMLTLMPLGTVHMEKVLFSKRKWTFYPIVGLQLVSGLLLVPFGLPVHPLETYLVKIHPHEDNGVVEGGRYSVPFEERYSQLLWPETMAKLQKVIGALPQSDQGDVLIWGKHYRQAGAVNLLGKAYGLPKAFSLHGSFYSWLPDGEMPTTVVALSYADADFFRPYFAEVILVERIANAYADEREKLVQYIFVCKGPKLRFDQLKLLFAERIFE
jgi:hypothetical protein